MKLDDLINKSLSKRPLLREKIKENRRKQVYNKICGLEDLILKRDLLATEIMNLLLTQENVDFKKEEYSKLEKQIHNLLEMNGFSKSYLSSIYFCDKCKDTGYFNGKVCDCVLKDLVEDRLSESGISEQKRKSNFKNFNFSLFFGTFENSNQIIDSNKYMKKLVSFAKEYCQNFKEKPKNLYFYGNSGVGKTYFCLSMANYVIDIGQRAFFITSSDLFDCMYTYLYSFYKEKEIQDKVYLLKNIDFLVIDDLGSEAINKNNNSFLSIILDERIEKNLSTVISSNLSEYDLADIYDSRISSRIRGNFKFFPFPTEDLRNIISKNTRL